MLIASLKPQHGLKSWHCYYPHFIHDLAYRDITYLVNSHTGVKQRNLLQRKLTQLHYMEGNTHIHSFSKY